jgi:hypothetical protein
MSLCPNKNLKEFKELAGIFGDETATRIWVANGGQPLDLAPNGKPSKAFSDLLSKRYTRREALIEKSKTLTDKFKKNYDRERDENGEPVVKNLKPVRRLNIPSEEKSFLDTFFQADVNGFISKHSGIELKKRVNRYNYLLGKKGLILKEFKNGSFKLEDKNNSLYQLLPGNGKGPDKQLNDKLINFLSEFGISVEHLNSLKKRTGVDAVGAADIVNKLILISKGKEDISTLPEETAHFAIELLGENHPLVKRMMDVVIGTPIYEQVVADYSAEYNNDEAKLRKEAAGKMLAEAIIKKNDTSVDGGIFKTLTALWNNFLDFFKGANEKKLNDEVADVFGEVADKIFQKELSDFDTANLNKNEIFYQKDSDGKTLDPTIKVFKDSILKQIEVTKKRLAIFAGSGREKFIDKERALLTSLEKAYEDGKYLEGVSGFIENVSEEMLQTLGSQLKTGKLEALRAKLESGEDMDINEVAGQLRRMQNFFGAYKPILEGLKVELDNKLMTDKEVDKDTRINMLNMKKSIDKLLANTKTIEDNYYNLGIPLVAKVFKEFAGDRGLDKNGNPIEIDIEGALRVAKKDINILNRLFNSMAETDDVILMLTDKMVKFSKQKARLKVNEIKQDLLQAQKDLEAAGYPDTDWMYEKIDGKFTGNLIGPLDYSLYENNLKKFFEKLGPRPEEGTEELKEWRREAGAWLQRHTQPVPDASEIIEQKKKELSDSEYKRWISKNYKTFIHPQQGRIEIFKGELSRPNPAIYKNSEFGNLTEAQKKFYNKIRAIKDEADVLLPSKFRHKNRAPQIRKDWLERVKSGQSFVNVLKEGARESTERLVDDDDFGTKEFTDEQGRPVNFLPVYYTQKLGRWTDKDGKTISYTEAQDTDGAIFKETVDKDLSTNIVDTMLMYTNMAHNFGGLDKVINILEMSKDIVEKREVTKTDADGNPITSIFNNAAKNLKNITTPGAQSTSYIRLTEYYDMIVFGKFKEEEGKIFGTRLDQAKTLDTFGRYVAINNLAFNVFSGIANITFGGAMIRQEAVASQFIDNKDLLWADKTYASELPGVLGEIGARQSKTKLSLWMDMTDVLQDHDHQLRDIDSGRKTRVGKLFKGSSLYFINHAGEHMMQSRMSLALANRIKLKDSSGKEINLYDAYEIKGNNLKLKPGLTKLDGSEFTNDDLVGFVNRTNFVNKRLHGIYNDIDKSVIQKWALGRMALMFRKFIVPGANRRFEKMKYNEEGEAWTEGYYRTSFKFIKNLIGDLKAQQFTLVSRFKELNDTEKANLMRTATEAAYMIAAAVLANVLTGLADDDDDNWMLAMSAYQANRLYTELRFYSSPSEGLKILKSPAAGVNTLQDFLQFLEVWTWNEEITRGRYKGITKFQRGALKIVPTYKTIHKAFTPEEELVFFK